MTGTFRRHGRRTRRAVAVAAVAATGAVVAATGAGLPDGEDAGDANSSLPPATARVARQTLADTETASGELGYGDTTTSAARLGGTVTGLPATGSIVKRGEALYRVDNAPVVLLYGTLPAYRTLSSGIEGADVKQFEKSLYALGYRGFTVDDEYTSATAGAVEDWQDDLGLPETGAVALGRVAFAPGPVRVDSHQLEVGDAVQPGKEVLAHTGTSRVVTVELEVSDQRLAKKGAAVTVTLPDGEAVPGKIADTETVVDPGDESAPGGDDAETKIEVTVTVADAKSLAGLDQAELDVDFTASERKNVLTVPVAALLALAEGGYGVEVVDGTTTRIVAVQTGLFAGGRVEVSGGGLADGTMVGMPA